jgi:hypothetical protein
MGRRERGERSRREPLELSQGYNYSRGRIPNVGAAAPLPKVVRVIVLVAIGVGLLVTLAALTGSEGPVVDFLRTALAAGRGVAMIGGSLALVLTLLYYYSAGIDWPKETAFRLLMIAAAIGIMLWVGVMALEWAQGSLDGKSVTSFLVLLVLVLAALLGYLGQRDG